MDCVDDLNNDEHTVGALYKYKKLEAILEAMTPEEKKRYIKSLKEYTWKREYESMFF